MHAARCRVVITEKAVGEQEPEGMRCRLDPLVPPLRRVNKSAWTADP